MSDERVICSNIFAMLKKMQQAFDWNGMELCKWQDVCSKEMEKHREEDCLLSLCLRGQGRNWGLEVTNETN